jgi:hypothetical protein
MSEENIERAYRGYDAFNRGDLGTFLGLISSEVAFSTRFIELEEVRVLPGGAPRSGEQFEAIITCA